MTNSFHSSQLQSPWPLIDPLNFIDDASVISSQQRQSNTKVKIPLPDFLSQPFNSSSSICTTADFQSNQAHNSHSNRNQSKNNNLWTDGKGVDRVLFSQEQIASRVKEIGAQISRDYAGTKFVLVGILKGCYHFLSDLSRHIAIPHEMDTLGVFSYDGVESSQSINLYQSLSIDIKDKHILLVEDLVDTAFTLNWVLNSYFVQKKRGYASLNVCCLLDKFQSNKVPNYQFAVKPFIRYIGFQIENVHVFVVGYGMDYNQNYRSLPYIGTLKPSTNSVQLRTKSPVPILPMLSSANSVLSLSKSRSPSFTIPINNPMPSLSAACTIFDDGNRASAMNTGTVSKQNDDTMSLFSNGGNNGQSYWNLTGFDNLSSLSNLDSVVSTGTMATKSLKAKTYKCAHCPRTFLHQSNLTVHMKIHSASAHICRFCGKRFARLSNLRQHTRVHTNERPFKCTFCDKSFKQQHSLADHVRTHTGEKPFKCEFCSKAFAARCNLIVHRRVHS